MSDIKNVCETCPTPEPMQYPDYSASENSTPDELRAIAVRAMRDMLSVQWCADRNYAYRKNGAVNTKLFHYEPGNLYAGMPYTNAGSGIFQWLSYYDHESGVFRFDGDSAELNANIGNSCAACVCWGWSPVCSTTRDAYASYNMTRIHGYLPVGSYTYPEDLNSFRDLPTDVIVERNGADVMLESYACIRAADGLVSTKAVHVIMAIENAHVVRDADGKIDPEESYVMIQDQRGGKGEGFYERERDGKLILFSGRTEYKFTFARLLELCYLPCTSAEFIGKKPYSPATAAFEGNGNDLTGILDGEITGNYAPCVLKATLTDEQGTREELAFATYNSSEKGTEFLKRCKVNKLALTEADVLSHMQDGKTYTFALEFTPATGDVLIPIRIPLTK